VGYFTTHFVDLERVFDVIRVHGHDYPISHSILNNTSRQNKQANKPWKVGFVKTHTWEYAPLYAKEAIKDFAERLSREQNIEVVEADIPPELKDSHIIHSTIYDKTLSYYFKEEFQKADLVSPILNDLIRHGNNITVSQYQQALGSQEKLSHLMDEYLQHFDIIFSLSTSGAAPKRDEMEKPDPSLMWTMTHLPVISAPIFKSPEGLPFGVQFAARRYNDRLLFKFCKYLLTLGLIPEGPNPRINM
jgi:Asp-tRNA(Asn)/Glu-tRNA(Gln) amidotransferase A subunit family amidase